ncbi:MAG: hypothetical protein OXG91_01975, partial [bacterium]|nr:hypothetical protein [bacterium]
YWMDDEGDGGLVANDYQDFCNEEQPWRSSTQPAEWWRAGTLADHRNENGAPHADSDWPWTGSENDCRRRSSHYLGASPNVEFGRHRENGRLYGPLSNGQRARTETRSMYAMSPEFIVAGPIHVSVSATDQIMTEGSSTDTAEVEVSLSRDLVEGETINATYTSLIGYTLALDGAPAGVTLNTGSRTITFSGAGAPRSASLTATAAANSVANPRTVGRTLRIQAVSGIAGATFDTSGQGGDVALYIRDSAATGPEVSLSVSPDRVAEGGTVTVTVSISPTRTSSTEIGMTLSGPRASSFGAATTVTGSVYNVHTSYHATIPANASSASFRLTAPSDNTAQQAQRHIVYLAGTNHNSGLRVTSPGLERFTVEPSDYTAASPLVKVGLPDIEGISRNDYDQQVREESQSPLSFTVTADPAPTANKDVCVDVVETGGDRVSAANEGRRTVTILANSTTGTLSVPYTDTADDEPDSAVVARVVGGTGCTGYTVSAEEPADEALVKDDEATLVSLTSDDTRMTEGDASDTATAKLALSRPLRAREKIEVRLTLTTATGARLPGHATPDFAVAATGAGVTASGLATAEPKLFFTGSASGEVQEATVTLTPVSGLDDGDTAHEIVTLALVSDSVLSGRGLATTVSGGVGRGSDFSQQLVLTDDEGGALPTLTVAVVGGHGHIAEGGTRRIRIQSDQAALPGGIAVAGLASGSSYSSGYAGAVPSSATIPSGSTSVDFDISVTNNSADADYGALTWTLPENDALYSRGDPHTVRLVIADDDIASPIPRPEVYEFPYLKWHVPGDYYLRQARYLADGTWTITRYRDPPKRKNNGLELNADDYYWHRDLRLFGSPLDYKVWFRADYLPTGPVTLTVKAVSDADNNSAETGRVAFSVTPGASEPPWGQNGTYTDDELAVTLNPEHFTVDRGGAVSVKPGFAVWVKPLVSNECVDVTHTLSGGGYGSVTMETMRIHLMSSTQNLGDVCSSYLDAERFTAGRMPGYMWMSAAHDLTGSSEVPVSPATVSLHVGRHWTVRRGGGSGDPIAEGQVASFTVRYIGNIFDDPLPLSVTVAQTGDVIDTGNYTPGANTVNIPPGIGFTGAVQFDVPTRWDNLTEPDGSITVTLNAGAGYRPASSSESATVRVTDAGTVPAGSNSPTGPPRPDLDGRPQIHGGPGDADGNPIGSNAPQSPGSGPGGGPGAPPRAQGPPGGLPRIVEGGDGAVITLRLATALEGDEQVRAVLAASGATPGEDYTLTLDAASSPGVTVSEDQPLSAARSLLTFSAGADRAVLKLTALADAEDEDEQLTLALDGAAYFDGSGDAVHVPVQQSLTFAIVDAADPEAAAVHKLVLDMIDRHTNVTGNQRALANWRRALDTLLGAPGGFTLDELRDHAAGVRRGQPRERWQRVLALAQ